MTSYMVKVINFCHTRFLKRPDNVLGKEYHLFPGSWKVESVSIWYIDKSFAEANRRNNGQSAKLFEQQSKSILFPSFSQIWKQELIPRLSLRQPHMESAISPFGKEQFRPQEMCQTLHISQFFPQNITATCFLEKMTFNKFLQLRVDQSNIYFCNYGAYNVIGLAWMHTSFERVLK